MVTVCAPAAAATQNTGTSQSKPTPAIQDRRSAVRPPDRITPGQTDLTLATARRPIARAAVTISTTVAAAHQRHDQRPPQHSPPARSIPAEHVGDRPRQGLPIRLRHPPPPGVDSDRAEPPTAATLRQPS